MVIKINQIAFIEDVQSFSKSYFYAFLSRIWLVGENQESNTNPSIITNTKCTLKTCAARNISDFPIRNCYDRPSWFALHVRIVSYVFVAVWNWHLRKKKKFRALCIYTELARIFTLFLCLSLSRTHTCTYTERSTETPYQLAYYIS